jgi:RimJ/RimL family protein N-acetyltransferase
VSEPVFSTARLDVRAWTHDDVEAMYDIYRRWEVARWLGATPKVAASVEQMHATVDRWAARDQDPCGIWAVVPRGSAGPVGTVLLVPLQDGTGNALPEVEAGWHFHPAVWGRGYATESAQGALQRAWAAGLGEVHAVVLPGNDASVAVTRRLGMHPLGRTSRFYGIEMDLFGVAAPSGSPAGEPATG